MGDWKVAAAASDLSSRSNDTCENATFISYHIHVLFYQNNPGHVTSAIRMRNAFLEHFQLYPNRNCSMTMGDPAPGWEMCAFDVELPPAGPFPTGQFAFFVPPHRYVDTAESRDTRCSGPPEQWL